MTSQLPDLNEPARYPLIAETVESADAEVDRLLDGDSRWVAERLPLPTVDDIAVPLLRGIHLLYELGVTGEGMRQLVEHQPGEWTPVGRELLELRHRVFELVVAAFDSRTTRMSDVERHDVRHVLERLSDVDDLDLLTGSIEVDALLDRDAEEARRD